LQKDNHTYKDLAEEREKLLEENRRLCLELKSAADQERNKNNVYYYLLLLYYDLSRYVKL